MTDEPPRWIRNRRTAKSGFLNLAFLLLDGAGADFKRTPLQELRRRLPPPTEPAPSNGVTIVARSVCGRGNYSLRLDMKDGWLCVVCAREKDIREGLEEE